MPCDDTCAVCGAPLDPDSPPATSQYQGETYCCCCLDCKEAFDQDPQLYAVPQAA